MKRNSINNLSKKHHYIPQFYLRGFTNNKGSYYLFDKKTRKISCATPSNSFYEKDRNTGIVDGVKNDDMEKFYGYYENKAAPYFNQLTKAFNDDELILNSKIIRTIKFFIICLHFRTPGSDYAIDKLIDNMSFKECGFDFIQAVAGSTIITPDIEEKLKKNNSFRKLYRLFIPFSLTQSEYWTYDLKNWKIHSHHNHYQVTGDNPIILKHPIFSLQTGKELILPISSNKTLINTSFSNTALGFEFSFYQDLIILHQSYRFVCCENKEYFEELIDAWEKDCLPDPHFESDIRKRIFNFFDKKTD